MIDDLNLDVGRGAYCIFDYEVNKLGRRFSDGELLDYIVGQSGDGGDMITSITNLNNGRILYETEGRSQGTYFSEYNEEPSFEEEVEEYKNRS